MQHSCHRCNHACACTRSRPATHACLRKPSPTPTATPHSHTQSRASVHPYAPPAAIYPLAVQVIKEVHMPPSIPVQGPQLGHLTQVAQDGKLHAEMGSLNLAAGQAHKAAVIHECKDCGGAAGGAGPPSLFRYTNTRSRTNGGGSVIDLRHCCARWWCESHCVGQCCVRPRPKPLKRCVAGRPELHPSPPSCSHRYI